MLDDAAYRSCAEILLVLEEFPMMLVFSLSRAAASQSSKVISS